MAAVPYTTFQAQVLGFINRSLADVTVGSENLVLATANMAKREAQRRHNFKQNRTVGYISTSLAGAALSGVKTTPGGATALDIKLVEAAWLYTTVGSDNFRTERIPFITVGDTKLYFPAGSVSSMISPASPPNYVPQTLAAWIQGGSIYLTGTTTAQAILLDVIKWLPDYDGTNNITDFFLNYGHDWLLWKTVVYLTSYIKDDNRYPVSQRRINDAWNGLIAWDEDFAERAFDINNDD